MLAKHTYTAIARSMAVWSQKWYIVTPLVALVIGHWTLLLHGISSNLTFAAKSHIHPLTRCSSESCLGWWLLHYHKNQQYHTCGIIHLWNELWFHRTMSYWAQAGLPRWWAFETGISHFWGWSDLLLCCVSFPVSKVDSDVDLPWLASSATFLLRRLCCWTWMLSCPLLQMYLRRLSRLCVVSYYCLRSN